MSGHKLRKEKDCLNCGHIVAQHFCSHCGQENIEPRQPFHYLFTHFFEDLTHYDGHVWKTFRYLLFHPGKLTKEYLAGKRMRFVPPVRLYIFMSFIAFLLPTFMSSHTEATDEKEETVKTRTERINDLEDSKKEFAASAKNSNGAITPERIAEFNAEIDERIAELRENKLGDSIKTDGGWSIIGGSKRKGIETVKQFDSLQNALPQNEKYGWVAVQFIKKELQLKEAGFTKKQVKERFIESLIHKLPKALFLYLPFFAFWLWLFHNKKKWWYFDHGIFTFHYFSLLLLLISIGYLFALIKSWIGTNIVFEVTGSVLTGAECFYGFFYFFRSHSRVYGERKAISRLKGIALFIINLIFMSFFLTGLVVVSFYFLN